MTDTLSHEGAITTFPTADQIAASRWQGYGTRGDKAVFVALYESDANPGYFHCEVTFGTDAAETRRPVASAGVAMMVSHMLSERGFALSDLSWSAVKAWMPRPAPVPSPSVVYFLAAGPFIKIGKGTGDASKRASELQTGCPFPITILATMPGGVTEEKALHRRFARLRAHGEWFRAEDDLLAFIASLGGEGAQ